MADTPHSILLRMIRGFQLMQMIYTAAKLGIAELLADGPKSVDQLAKATQSQAPSLYRLLRALAGVGIFAEDTQGRFGLTPLAELLRKDVPGSLYHTTLYLGDAHFQGIWNQLFDSVKTGETGAQRLYGMSAWDYREQHPDLNDLFNGYMTELTSTVSTDFLAAYDFAGINTLIDLGGGHGTFVAEVLKANPQMHGIVFDLPHVVSGAYSVLEAAGVAD